MNKKMKQKHGIRKYKAGASSVLLGLFVFFGLITEEKASAAEILPGQSETSKKKNEGAPTNQSGTSASTSSGSVDTTATISQSTTEPSVNATDVSGNQVAIYPTPPNNDTADTTTSTNTTTFDASVTDTSDATLTKPADTTTPATTPTTTTSNSSTETTSTEPTSTQTDTSTATTSMTATETISAQLSTQPSTTTTTYSTTTNNTLTTSPTATTTPTSGSDITKNVQIVSSSIEGNSTVNPHNAERVTLKYDWKFPDGMKQGDYFDFILSNNVNTAGISTARKLPSIQNGSLVMATGQLINGNTIRYTFTDYINNKVNVIGNLSLNLFIDPKVVTHEGNQTITATLNGQTTTKTVNIDYLEGINLRGVNINGSIEYLDKNKNTFKHIAYVNPSKNTVYNSRLTGNIMNGAPTTNQPTVKIYKYLGTESLNQSVYVDTNNSSMFKDVTSDFKDRLSINSGGYYVDMNDLSNTYVVTYEGQYLNNANELNFRTELAGYPATYPYYYTSVKWDNGVVFYSNKGTGSGIDQPIIESNNFVFTEDTGNGVISGQYNGSMIEVEENPMSISYDTVSETISGVNNTVIEEFEDSAPIQYEENTIPDGMTGSQSTITEEIADTTPIEFEESTVPEPVTGSYVGAVEFYEDTNIVDYVEDTTPEGMTGSNTGVTEEIEESNVIDYVEDTTPEGMTGSNTGVTEEIEESNVIDYVEDTTPEGMTGSNTGVTEEIEESNVIDYVEDTTPEGMAGSNTGVTEEIEESNVIDYEEDTTPEGMAGSNTGVTEEIEETLVDEEITEAPKASTPSFSLNNVIHFNPMTRITGIGSNSSNHFNFFNTPIFNDVINEETSKDLDTPILDENKTKETLAIENDSEPILNEVTLENNVLGTFETNDEVMETNHVDSRDQSTTEATENEAMDNHMNETPSNDSKQDKVVSTVRKDEPTDNPNHFNQAQPSAWVQTEEITTSQQPENRSDQHVSNVTETTTPLTKQSPSEGTSMQNDDSERQLTEDKTEMKHEFNRNQATTQAKESATSHHAKETKGKHALPETGQSKQPSGILATLLAMFGILLVFRRRKQKDKS
ncbi:fibrinogen-binding adhesin SdrG C-terminal domain-containing protein [Staphylococcus hyicus]|uniref:fibrinogen-binding adhesin SdrG C-terminal domain-containing protein n=1 Tax=Staphylococcus hyicus TaxID=1284 RepID=UPI0014737836|nr:fibrinogen-binding adhesin SdrG C-terminal domain-containing protein [Staphylococcus hyicus]MCQ9291146.1 fibrinogen-binding adhesin SdrG C-terminal domain-containing protein [Staphylococcus hyicus]MCQ9306387.1 fibrinogen-binding adhesin SdrG C-terminal domain-containing protein [Staphylococcus hyicus]MCQ9308800.1 fibrinogen-binding adhesin SdrG C-terminal domain-containing protein [Staphylococcus hyicus]MCQ9311221.1 fibrinogen-binding adhesin SdrG C-terminal domain-containing protein [Staphy